MIEKFSIRSSRTDRQIEFSQHENEYFYVKLEGAIEAYILVYKYSPHDQDLATWFGELGTHKLPWKGKLSWQSFEGEFKIEATCDSTGHVQFVVCLTDLVGSNEDSYIRMGIETELGQIERISVEARGFFNS